MKNIRFTTFIFLFIILLAGLIVSCQKDENIKRTYPGDETFTADTASFGNYLAVKGTLKITIQDSTYTFNAANDSIAFVNVFTNNGQYFGITAINKAHNMSFGISSAGYPLNHATGKVAGSQFLLKPDKTDTPYTFTQYPNTLDTGKISLEAYKQDSVLAKGTFYTYMTRDVKARPAFYKVKGTFSLRLK